MEAYCVPISFGCRVECEEKAWPVGGASEHNTADCNMKWPHRHLGQTILKRDNLLMDGALLAK